MWLNLKLKLIQTDDGYSPEHSKGGKWVVVQLKAGYTANTFPPAEGQRVSENFYKFITSLTQKNAPIGGIYRIVENDTGTPDDLYKIGPAAMRDSGLKVWSYERDSKRLFLQTISTSTGTPQSGNKNTVETDADVALNDVIPITNGFVRNGSSGGYGTGDVLRLSPERKPFAAKGRIYWESGRYF